MGKGYEKIPRQGKDLRNSQKLRKVVAIYKTSKLVLSRKCISLKTRGSVKAPYCKEAVSDLFSVIN